ncbi:hypothetical protein ANCCAN_25085 [Ancylostoma caninum]|uniref:Uncharacterized protein n=1 Tax=Ancylostoma caninum TaxID=29170 RepID=A0A368FDS6_ANCCA|nr:hypothetical protein ANCCAN_25085 [Ancylostoma caninum]
MHSVRCLAGCLQRTIRRTALAITLRGRSPDTTSSFRSHHHQSADMRLFGFQGASILGVRQCLS